MFGPLDGIEIRFGLRFDEEQGWMEKEQEENIKGLLDLLNSHPLDYEYSYFRKWEQDTQPYSYAPHFSIKCKREEERKRITSLFPHWSFVKEYKHITWRTFEVCTVDNCYKETAANGKHVHLYVDEVEAQEAHEIHEYCVLHVASKQSRQIARTIETTVEVPGHIMKVDMKREKSFVSILPRGKALPQHGS